MKNAITILFATESGNAESLARRCFARVEAVGWPAEIHNASERHATDLTASSTLILFASTWGSGEPPTDAQEFYDELLAAAMPSLPDLTYAVFGLGDTGYGDDFCACARRFDDRLAELGAQRLLPLAQSDTDFEHDYANWEPLLLAHLAQTAATPPACT